MNTIVKIKHVKHSVSTLFIFLLIGMFAVFSLLLVLIGVGAYQGVVNDAQRNAQVRTSLSYIANKVRAADTAGGVSVEDWHGIKALLLREIYDDAQYETRIYYLPNEQGPGGGLYEQFVFAGDEWGPESGDRIADIDALTMMEKDGLLTLNLATAAGQSLPMYLRLHGIGQ
ncbi:MAG: DUF4860 domain-containing protein [Oscillospiraceae bacterium]|jgi:hypothetical protein|nr:DUF4860 domain-containing protein [Oscillospiraceae bacterium]